MKPRRIVDLLQDTGHRLVLGDRRVRLVVLGLVLAVAALLAWSLARAWPEPARAQGQGEAQQCAKGRDRGSPPHTALAQAPVGSVSPEGVPCNGGRT